MKKITVYTKYGDTVEFEGIGFIFDGFNKFFVVESQEEKKKIINAYKEADEIVVFYEFEDFIDLYNSVKVRRYLLWWRSLENGEQYHLTEANGDVIDIDIE